MVISRRSLLVAGAAIPASAYGQCVVNAPAVDACRGGVRNAAPAGQTLDLNFMFPGSLDPRITFTRASSATYTDASGVIQTAATNAPRWDYGPVTHALRGVLIEEQRTNVAFPSVPSVAGGWSVNGSTPTPNMGIAPDGTNTMSKLVDDGTNNIHCSVKVFSITASQQYTFSAYLKMNEIRYFSLLGDDGGAIGFNAVFDLQAGVISGPITAGGGATTGAATMQAVGNGVYRCSVSGTLAAATLFRCSLIHMPTSSGGGFPSYQSTAGNGTLVWGAQLEQGAFATSYIPTTSVSVTRAADSAVMPTAGWFNAAAGTLRVEAFAPPSGALAANNTTIAEFDDGGVSNVIEMRSQFSALDVRLSSFVGNVASGVAIASGSLTGNTLFKGAIAYGTAPVSGKAGLNGATPGVAPGVTAVPSGITTLRFGPGRASALNNALRGASYWPRILSDVEFQQVTT